MKKALTAAIVIAGLSSAIAQTSDVAQPAPVSTEAVQAAPAAAEAPNLPTVEAAPVAAAQAQAQEAAPALPPLGKAELSRLANASPSEVISLCNTQSGEVLNHLAGGLRGYQPSGFREIAGRLAVSSALTACALKKTGLGTLSPQEMANAGIELIKFLRR